MKKSEKVNIILEILGCQNENTIKACTKWLNKNVNTCKLIMSETDYKQLQYEIEDDKDAIELYKNVNVATDKEIKEIINLIENDKKAKRFDDYFYSEYIISENGIINYDNLNLFVLK